MIIDGSIQPSELYRDYVDFKGWRGLSDAPRHEDFAEMCDLVHQPGPLKVLEIGFGRGDFLAWALWKGHATTGVEIIPELVEMRRMEGHEAILASEIDTLPSASFDAIFAADVLEHLTLADLDATLRAAARLLKPGGAMVARFPNGDSPFAGRFQNGDMTHVRALTARSLEQVARPAGMRVTHSQNPRALPEAGRQRLKRRAAFLARDLIETAICLIYYGYRTPLDPNTLVVLRHA